MKAAKKFSAPIEVRPEPEPGGLAAMARAWDRFWFRPSDPFPLGLIRILVGTIILYIHLIYSLDLVSFFGEHAWLDEKPILYMRGIEGGQNGKGLELYLPATDWQKVPEVYAHGFPYWSVFYHIHDSAWLIVVHVFFLLGMFLFTIGFATRITSVITWVGVISYINREPILVFGMDSIMVVLAFYLMLGPSGSALSVDRLLARWWARRTGAPLPPAEPPPSVAANCTLRAMQVHFCFIYLASGLSKLQGAWWWAGTALWGTMANYSFAPMHWPLYLDFLRFLAKRRILWECVMFFGTYYTLALEISLPFLIWRRSLRWLMVICAVLLHTGIGIIMGLTTFSLVMLCLLLSFIPAPVLRRFFSFLGASRPSLLTATPASPSATPRKPGLAG
jgi:hypothetical protein